MKLGLFLISYCKRQSEYEDTRHKPNIPHALFVLLEGNVGPKS